MDKKLVFGMAIPIILIASYLDTLFIGRMEFKEYLFQCFWEYTIFWMGYWMCEKVNKI